jgi:hypothetical protein
MHRKPNEILWTINSGNFVKKYDIPLTFSLIDFASSREIQRVPAANKTGQPILLRYDYWTRLQHAMGMDILFSSQQLRWDGIEVQYKLQIQIW